MRKPAKLFISLSFFTSLLVLSTSNSHQAHAAIPAWQKGQSIRLNNQSQTEVLSSLKALAATGANWVTVTPGYLTDSPTSSNVERKAGTPSDEILIYMIQEAHKLGLKVMIKPHLDIKSAYWRGVFDPSDKAAFFKNYKAMLMHYTNMAKTYDVEQVSLGSELPKISTNPANESYWRDIIKSMRAVYSGKLTYNANVDTGIYDETKLPFWDALDSIGLSFYRSMASIPDPTMDQLLARWKSHDATYVTPLLKYNKPIMFTEIGFRSVEFAANKPWEYGTSGQFDMEIQKNLYSAFFEYWKDKSYMTGAHLWDWKVTPISNPTSDNDYTPQGKPALAVMTSYFKSGANSGSTPTIPNNPSTPGNPTTPNNPTTPGNQPTESPATSSLLKLNDTKNFALGKAANKAKFYTDRNYTLKSVPAFLAGKDMILTKNSHKYTANSANYLTLKLSKSATMFVAYDSRAKSVPLWLSDWTKTEDTISTTDTKFNLYRKYFTAGTVTLGGNGIPSNVIAASNYFVIVTEQTFASSQNAALPENSAQPSASVTAVDPQNNSTVTPSVENPKSTDNNDDQAAVQGIVLESPEDKDVMSGEKKIKISIPGLALDKYTASYQVDDRLEENMPNDLTNRFKQAKIQFDNWNWNGSGPYKVTIKARDLSGKVLDEMVLTLFVNR